MTVTTTGRSDAVRIGAGSTVPGHVHDSQDILGAAQEVMVQTTTPAPPGIELWVNPQTIPLLYYRDPVSKVFKLIQTGPPPSHQVLAGAGLNGGGDTEGSGATLDVGVGIGLTVSATAVSLNTAYTDGRYVMPQGESSLTITDWNQAVENGVIYRASGAAHAPDTGWFQGWCLSHSTAYKQQYVTPYANTRWPSAMLWYREQENGTWGDWNRLPSYVFSRDLLDAGTFTQHNASGSNYGIRRFFHGHVKDKNTNAASAADEWRVSCYDTAGNYLWAAIRVPQSGLVTFPKGTSGLLAAMQTAEPVANDTVATVGTVAAMIETALANAGVLSPQARATVSRSLTGLNLVEPEPDDRGEPTV